MPVTKATRYVKELEAENAKLRALIQCVVEIGPSLHAGSIAEIIYGKTAKAERLRELLKDCKAAIAEAKETDAED